MSEDVLREDDPSGAAAAWRHYQERVEALDILIDDYRTARTEYDERLYQAFKLEIPDDKGGVKRLSEDRAKLEAREMLRRDGIEDPEILKLRIWARIGVRVIE